MNDRIYLSPPFLTGNEEGMVIDALRSGWVAPLGPHVDSFETELAELIGVAGALAVSSGTAAIHLALRILGIGDGDTVIVSSLTFAGSVFPILYQGAKPVFIDSEDQSWNMDPDILEEALEVLKSEGTPVAAVIVVHLYGQSADMSRIGEICQRYNVPIIEDAAEALGSTYGGMRAGSFGQVSIFSFNGNKMITASSGGAILSDNLELIGKARKLATQARENVLHYEHAEVGYNYRLSNVLAALGRAQLLKLDDRIAARRRNFTYYRDALGELEGLMFMPDAGWGLHTRWLTALTIDSTGFRKNRNDILAALEAENIETRPVWKPMHAQPVFEGARYFGRTVSDQLFRDGLCLPSGADLKESDLERIVNIIKGMSNA